MKRRAANREEVADRIHSAAIHLLRRVAREDVASGIGPAQLSALSVLIYGGARTLTELAEAERVRPPTMTRIVNALADAGLVLKNTSSDDRRSVRITVTSKGRRLFQAARRRRLQELTRRLESLSPGELRTLERAAELMEEVAR
jgi:DNA-binding MarR family transcriptional regulator